MPNSPRQFTLPLKFDSALAFATFWAGSNAQLVAHLIALSEGRAQGWAYIAGSHGSGVSHLLQASVNQASAAGQQVIYLSLQEMLIQAGEHSELNAAELMDAMEHYQLLCIDDIDALADQPLWQEALFYLLVKLQAQPNVRVIFGGSDGPNNLGLALADLRSRLAGATQFRLQPYSDTDKLRIMQYHAAQRGCEISDEVAQYIVQRFSRDLPSLIDAVHRLDQYAMSESRKLTIPFAKKILQL
ncbi:MAG: DnaA regulatory inactivator Hda [Pseudomonadales bacterium]|nr:DnaA regulatory inactivator Hda [Gammaproteobacteria bacterium]NNL57157.1 DnaA regulatory inactivator Hda [Pseudomonadales bacterium]